MNYLTITVAVALLLGAGIDPLLAGNSGNDLKAAAVRATAEDPATAAAARAELRGAGPAGLDALYDANAEFAGLFRNETLFGPAPGIPQATNSAWKSFCQAADEIGAQHDDAVSRLYWYKDFEQAKAAARAAGKPILSLRLLGNLDEEFSCANSRFFRTTLYPNAEVSKYLRDHFILHWKSVRPVPRITIDFGDGRKMERTITGNSIHYILMPDGQPVDALPGLYGAKAFLRGLAAAEREAAELSPLEGAAREAHLRQYHERCLAETSDLAARDVKTAGIKISGDPESAAPGQVDGRPAALKELDKLGDSDWNRIAFLHLDDGALDPSSRALITSKIPTAIDAGRLTGSKMAVENPLTATILNLQRSISGDTVRNEYLLHARLHSWFASGVPVGSVDRLNASVYAQLFLMPDSDPWLGLAPANTFTGLDIDHATPSPRSGRRVSFQPKSIQPPAK